ncbi:unnamed protein product [Allacma fusca]|uniref:Uncharacterized protein n=1 Tax=Allacma fusca TaxID=39272 RepID=A0A8J2KA14_9HEXA|nr:unnamed protein product [Allacma fusca]
MKRILRSHLRTRKETQSVSALGSIHKSTSVQKKSPIMSITASGQALNVGNPRGPNTFQINVDDDVDVTQMKISIHGPAAPEIWTNNRGGGLLEVSYRIGLVGRYMLYITYQGKSIPGSPYTLIVR